MSNLTMQGIPGASPVNNIGLLPNVSVQPSQPFFGNYGANQPTQPNVGIPGLGGNGGGEMSWMDRASGWAPAVEAFSGLANSVIGLKQYKLAKDSFGFNKQMSLKNYESQRRLTNSHLEDRQHARVASNPGAYESVGTYMENNGVQ